MVIRWLYCVLFCAITLSVQTSYATEHDDDCAISTNRLSDNCTLTPSCNQNSAHYYPLLNCSRIKFINFSMEQLPQNIREILFEFDSIPPFSINELLLFPNLTSLQLRSDQITKLVGDEFHSSSKKTLDGLKKFVIAQSPMKEIPRSFIKRLPNLSELILSRNELRRILHEDLCEMKNLESVYIGHNPVKTLELTWLSKTTKLRSLSLRSTQLHAVPTAFGNTTSMLKFLDLSDNHIDAVSNKAFQGLLQLNTLLLGNNEIQSIDKHAFEGLVNLKILDLAANKLSIIEDNIFEHFLVEGLTVSMWENEFHCDCNLGWLPAWLLAMRDYGNYPDIKLKCYNPARLHDKSMAELNASDFLCYDEPPWEDCPEKRATEIIPQTTKGNSVTTAKSYTTETTSAESSLEQEFVQKCPTKCTCYYRNGCHRWVGTPLKYPVVDCSDQKLSDIPAEYPIATRSLLLGSNTITQLNLVKFSELKNLAILDLKRNNLKEITSVKNLELPSLRYLFLSSNRIQKITSQTLKSLSNIVDIRIHNNRISRLSGDLFKHTRLLKRVYLGPNKLVTQIDGNLLHGLQLQKIVLRGLNIGDIGQLVKHQGNATEIDLSDNMISILQSNALEGCTSLIDLDLEHNQLNRIMPRAFSHSLYLESIDLSENKLTRLDSSSFSDVGHFLTRIELWENPFRCDCKMLWLKDWITLLDADNPSSDIRFRCQEPERMRESVSDNLHPGDFVCLKGDDCHDCNTSPTPHSNLVYSKNDLAAAIIVTFIVTVLILVIGKCVFSKLAVNRHTINDRLRYSAFHNHHSTLSLRTNEEDDVFEHTL